MKKILADIRQWSTQKDLKISEDMISSRQAAKTALKKYRQIEKKYKKLQEEAQSSWDDYIKKQDEFLKTLNKKD